MPNGFNLVGDDDKSGTANDFDINDDAITNNFKVLTYVY